jgi:hypothetical protein
MDTKMGDEQGPKPQEIPKSCLLIYDWVALGLFPLSTVPKIKNTKEIQKSF